MSVDLHVGAYNHFEGGIDLDGTHGRSLERLDAQLDMLAPLGLDVLISTEANGWFDGDGDALELARERLGMKPLWVIAPRHDCHVVIWVRTERLRDPQEHHESGHPWWHAQARVSVAVERLRDRLWLFGAHFSPTVPGIRVHEAYATSDLGDRLTVGGGDFNDDALFDPIPNRAEMSAARRLRHARAGGETAAGVLAAAEFGDVAALVQQRTGVRPEPTAGFKDGAPIRCDRLYVSKRLHETAREFAALPYDLRLSDHRAVHAWLDLSAAL